MKLNKKQRQFVFFSWVFYALVAIFIYIFGSLVHDDFIINVAKVMLGIILIIVIAIVIICALIVFYFSVVGDD